MCQSESSLRELLINIFEDIRKALNPAFWNKNDAGLFETTKAFEDCLELAANFKTEYPGFTQLTLQELNSRLRKMINTIRDKINPEQIIFMTLSRKVPAFQEGFVLYSGFSELSASTDTGITPKEVKMVNEVIRDIAKEEEYAGMVKLFDIDKEDGIEDPNHIQILDTEYPVEDLFSEEEVKHTAGERITKHQLHLSTKGSQVILHSICTKFMPHIANHEKMRAAFTEQLQEAAAQ